ncbi:MAG: MaoC family dehydratase [Gammaproteobacteria bacterium]|uniref:MaoC family dehydratase n=1 Tax=SAR86 cluster bacterium TaxID=2030880 RepID=A0A520N1K3_9GAMM|nr:protein dehydratase [Gammaproteobacteria bacterium]RPG34935.1 MAG: MaoC family dehydratase [Gammaproteobacteria bacterium TMED193]RZO27362.1 MAG: MaoC family dehydratase [SAR86 cluster bacterium]MAV83928.1 protein dehydratase [Gammaproteobacteria bacterium]MBH36642.1 protein dehydratase [Gammaproteobacteria bacterium]|tara:strand:- start:2 stop:451 length:450 start_codon:yes stop_codon:yes gene_type:complete
MEAIKPEDLHTMIGKEQFTSWFVVDQERINVFADVSEDPQFIHVDPEKAAPIFGSTIAHGALMLSLSVGKGYENAIPVEGTKMAMNYGYDKIRFITPVPVDSNCRFKSSLLEATDKGDGRWLLKTKIELEIEGVEKPGFVAENLAMVFV